MAPDKKHYLPDFCAPEVLLKLFLTVEFTAIVFSVLTINTFSDIYTQTGLVSFFMLFVVLSSVATLCGLSKLGVFKSHFQSTLITLLVFSFYTIAITSWVFMQNQFVTLFKIDPNDIWFLVIKFEIISIICIGTGLRYLYVQYEKERQLNSENNARLQALQARIRPHFLFNSMNTIASLVHESPDQAEQATINLSHLFRASLSEQNLISLKQEIKLTLDYIDLELLRLDERLKVIWHKDDAVLDVLIPPLTLQPLVENAIYHGIEPMVDGGEIVIDISVQKPNILIEIRNPYQSDTQRTQGNQMALRNINERLDIAFKGKSYFKSEQVNDVFIVSMRIPIGDK